MEAIHSVSPSAYSISSSTLIETEITVRALFFPYIYVFYGEFPFTYMPQRTPYRINSIPLDEIKWRELFTCWLLNEINSLPTKRTEDFPAIFHEKHISIG